MKRLLFTFLGLFTFLTSSFAQVTVSDDLSWVPNFSSNITRQSPMFEYCDDQQMYYTITDVSQNPLGFTANTVYAPFEGIVIPDDFDDHNRTQFDYQIVFSQPVTNVRIHFKDLNFDSDPANEYIEFTVGGVPGSAVPTSSTPTQGATTFTTNGTTLSTLEFDNYFASAWANWNGPLNAIEFTYFRPSGMDNALLIDRIEFDTPECCPELSLVYDCQEGVVNLVGLPGGITNVETKWTYSRKLTGRNTIIYQGSTLVDQVSTAPYGSGWYSVMITFTLPGGTECSFSGIIFVDTEVTDCCEYTGPVPTVNVNNDGFETISCGTFPRFCGFVPVRLFADCETEYFYGIQSWNPNTCQPGNFINTVNGVGTLPGGSISLDLLPFGNLQDNQWYMFSFSVYAPGWGWVTSYHIFKYVDECSTNRLIGEESNNSFSRSFTVGPNPADNFVNVSFDSSFSGDISLINLVGQQIDRQSVKDSHDVSIDVSNVLDGQYFIQVQYENGEVETRKILVQ